MATDTGTRVFSESRQEPLWENRQDQSKRCLWMNIIITYRKFMEGIYCGQRRVAGSLIIISQFNLGYDFYW